jgi:V/A-type H+-transporting ATPase subunit I
LYTLLWHQNTKKKYKKILHTHNAEIFSRPPDLPGDNNKALKEVKSRLRENLEKEKEASNNRHRLGEENRHNLDSWKETSQNILTLLKAEKQILQSGKLATIKGYVPQNRFHELENAAHDMLNEKIIVMPDESQKSPATEPPSKIMHSRWIKPFEEITRLYGVPKYDEIDPTPVIAITFPILFGLMFGDMGHGLILLVGGAVMGSRIKRNQGIKNICWIMATCGVVAIVTGALFGEFFGQPFFEPLWLNPFHGGGVFEFLVFSLVVGIVQITSGIVIEMANYAIKHNWADALLTSAPKIAFYLGGVYLIAVYQLDFATWLSGPILIPLIPFIIMVVGKPLFLMAIKPKKLQLGVPHTQQTGEHTEQDTLAGRFFEGGDTLTRLLSNTISYSRILALLMAHWALMLVIYTVAGLIAPKGAGLLAVILAGVVIVLGNVFVLALEGLIVFIHTLRLHFYEWFSKFYAGTGTEFKPYKQSFAYTNLTFKDRKTNERKADFESFQTA